MIQTQGARLDYVNESVFGNQQMIPSSTQCTEAWGSHAPSQTNSSSSEANRESATQKYPRGSVAALSRSESEERDLELRTLQDDESVQDSSADQPSDIDTDDFNVMQRSATASQAHRITGGRSATSTTARISLFLVQDARR